jgi:hypothetical protein
MNHHGFRKMTSWTPCIVPWRPPLRILQTSPSTFRFRLSIMASFQCATATSILVNDSEINWNVFHQLSTLSTALRLCQRLPRLGSPLSISPLCPCNSKGLQNRGAMDPQNMSFNIAKTSMFTSHSGWMIRMTITGQPESPWHHRTLAKLTLWRSMPLGRKRKTTLW